MKYIDLHCDTLYELEHRKTKAAAEKDNPVCAEEGLYSSSLCVDLKKMYAGDALLQAFACFVDMEEQGGADGAWDYVMELLNLYESEMAGIAPAVKTAETANAAKIAETVNAAKMADAAKLSGIAPAAKRADIKLKLCLNGSDAAKMLKSNERTLKNAFKNSETAKNSGTVKNSETAKNAQKLYISDEKAANDEHGMYALLTVEEGGILNNEESRLERLYERGIRLITLTWNYENCLGYPNSTNAQKMSKGLKPFGKTMVEKMNDLKMIVDVSHLSDGGFYDVADMMKSAGRPFLASHSCARALCAHPRNLTDDMLKIIGNSGGIVGVNFYGAFLNSDGKSDLASIIAHLKYIVNKAGTCAVALGSDFDGFSGGCEIENAAKMPILFDAMAAAGFKTEEIEKIAWRNAAEFLKISI